MASQKNACGGGSWWRTTLPNLLVALWFYGGLCNQEGQEKYFFSPLIHFQPKVKSTLFYPMLLTTNNLKKKKKNHSAENKNKLVIYIKAHPMIMVTDLFNFYDLFYQCRSCDDQNCFFQICHISDALCIWIIYEKTKGKFPLRPSSGKQNLLFL